MPKHRVRADRPPKNDLDALLLDILSSIAAILVSTGYGFSRVNELTKMAFVHAAHSVDLNAGPRLSIARIAALTGLTRLDVSQIIRKSAIDNHPAGKPTNRVSRVAVGWISDKKFSEKNGGARKLAFAGAGNTFSTLVRQYSGDIPPKAMLTEMVRLGMVRRRAGGLLVLVRSGVVQSRRTTNALKAAIPWIGFLAKESTRQVNNDLTSLFEKFELRFSSLPQVFAVMRELRGRHSAFVKALEQLGSRVDDNGHYSLNVSVAVAATNPSVSISRRPSGTKGVKRRNRQ